MNTAARLVAISADPLETWSDAELLVAWNRDHDRDAFSMIVRRHAALVLGVCRRQCRRCQDVDDAFQATFLCLMRSSHKVRSPEHLVSWLYGTAYRTAVAARRRQHAEASLGVTDPPVEHDPLAQLSRRHELRILDEELARLSEPHRTAIVLHWLEGLPTSDVASRLGVTTAVVRGRLQRGRRLLERRLRCRGVSAGAALAALAAWPVDAAVAAGCGQTFLASPVADANAASVNTCDFDSLLSTGTSSMTWMTPIVGCGVAALAVAAGLAFSPTRDAPNASQATASPLLSFGDAEAPFSATPVPFVADPPAETLVQQTAPQPQAPGAPPSDRQDRDPFGARVGKGSGTQQKIEQAMSEEAEFSFENVAVGDLAGRLREATGLPVISDPRGVELAGSASEAVSYQAGGLPLRVALSQMLRPLALRADVREDVVVITADTAELARRGIGANRWVSIDDDAAKRILDALEKRISINFSEEPLAQAVISIEKLMGVPVGVDRRALEEIGLTDDTPVTSMLEEVQARTALESLLRDLDLTFTIDRERLLVTTAEQAENQLLSRIYWLDGLGYPPRAYDDVMQLIQTTVSPDTWEALGGPSTMAPVGQSVDQRPGLAIAAPLTAHLDIEALLKTLRDSHLGPDVGAAFPAPAEPRQRRGMNRGMGGMNGGMGGMGGGMGSMGGGMGSMEEMGGGMEGGMF